MGFCTTELRSHSTRSEGSSSSVPWVEYFHGVSLGRGHLIYLK